ncbi:MULTISPECIES: type III pantothenate kinase [unclassified Spirosoma]|uniref:type III pantothenate kinase n=1 Tax=unclassified Spirosoma TaxID=2621999 RepID=UPI000965FAB0|nr:MULTISPECIES: type III pantothenate kinase [unclassified Spirosoma]MBN8821193.1 type III pantothenate kinase [Spirosoma sp.]OJW79179.1 MAG: pantothenate kinase [Spirosoma sp. 48-14]
MQTDTYPVNPSTALNLVVDWGNSSLKTGWFDGETLVKTARYNTPDALLAEFVHQPVAHVLVSSTSRPADEIRTGFMGLQRKFIVLDSQTALPIRKAYDTPHTLGADRVAAAVGAFALYPGCACLVLDLGTCLTADLIDQDAVFQGGLISPGLRMRFRAMHEQTARLPLVEAPVAWPALTAKNTQAAMQSGVVNGLMFELNGIIAAYRAERPEIVVLLCGGDGPAFESRLKPPIFAVPNLVLIGLNRILRYNVDNLQANTPDNHT